MKREIIFLLITIMFLHKLPAQSTYERIISGEDDQVLSGVVVNEEGYSIMVGSLFNNNQNLQLGYLVKLDAMGNLIEELTFQHNDTVSSLFLSIHYLNQYYHLLGRVMVDSLNDKLWYLKLSQDFEVVKDTSYHLVLNRRINYMNSIVDSENNLVIAGYTVRNDTNHMGNIIYNYDPFFFKTSNAGDSLTSVFYTITSPLSTVFDIIESKDSSKYFAFGWKFTEAFATSSAMLTLNKEFDSLDIDSIPLGVYLFYSPKYINESEMLIYGGGAPYVSVPYALNVLTITEEAEMINYNYFKREDETKDYPSIQNGISVNAENYYVGGTSNIDFYDLYFSYYDSWFHLVKINEDITPQWEYWYGGDVYYVLYYVLATNDGGCLMVGTRYDYLTQDVERDIYVVKVNSEGLITGLPENTQIEMHEAIVYPNPGNEEIKVRIAVQHKESIFELFDMSGRLALKENFAGIEGTVNSTFLPSGTYIYKITGTNGLKETGKWIKQ